MNPNWIVGLVCVAAAACCAAGKAGVRTLLADDVVFMYAADKTRYLDNGATVVAWGGGHSKQSVALMRELNMHPTGSMWCLTAGAKTLHENPALCEGVARDIANKKIAVPWHFDHTHQGIPSWWGCTNHPAFREHLRQRVREAMGGLTMLLGAWAR